jgi:hypothetical protein
VIDEFNADRTGWARFSDDMTMRYRLARALTQNVRELVIEDNTVNWAGPPFMKRVVFLMLNPSTADAFEPDPTVTECRKRSRAWGYDILEVVNLFALRSPHPRDLKKCAHGFRGDDAANNNAIRAAYTDAHLVIAAWGNDGDLDFRATIVCRRLAEHGVELRCLGTTERGAPKHPLARGKHRIPADFAPVAWSPP